MKYLLFQITLLVFGLILSGLIDANADDRSVAEGTLSFGIITTTPRTIVPLCGNGSIGPAEECDNGAQCDEGTNCDITVPDSCADGSTCAPRDGDGCSSTCKLEHPELCGNGVIDPGETCDDGNTNPLDGCSSTCQIELGIKPNSSGGCGNLMNTSTNEKEGMDDAKPFMMSFLLMVLLGLPIVIMKFRRSKLGG
jgi:cysteine-rich repeat protein